MRAAPEVALLPATERLKAGQTRRRPAMRVLWIVLLCLMPFSALADIASPKGRVLVTVGGDLPEGNVAPSGEDAGNFFAYLDVTFSRGVAFDDDMLAALPQGTIRLPSFGPWSDVTFTGPFLTSVLDFAGASERMAQPMSLDRYQVDLPWDNIAALRPILATHANGVPLALGGFGPTAIIYPKQDDAALQEELDALQVWAVVFIGVQ